MTPNDRRLMNLGLVISFIAVLGAAVAGGELDEEAEGENGTEVPIEPETMGENITGNLDEGQTDQRDYLPGNDENAVTLTARFLLTWTDEQDADLVGLIVENDPDRFNLTVTNLVSDRVWSEDEENRHGEEGEIAFVINDIDDEWQGEWTVEVTLVEAGDQVTPIGGIGLSDNSNEYQLMVEFEYLPQA